MSIEQIVEVGLRNNPDLLAARQRLVEAQALERQAGLRPNPGLEISVGNGDVLNSSGERDWSFAYSHKFELGGKRDRRLNVSRLGIELARIEITNRERLLASEIKISCAEALAAARNLRNAEELLRLTSHSLRLAEARSETGEGAPLEQGLLQVEVNRLDSDRLAFATRAENALLGIKLLAGLPLEEDLRILDSLDKTGEDLPSLGNSVEVALTRRPDLAAARLREELAEAEMRMAKSAGTPDLVVQAGYSRVQSSFDQFGFSQPGGMLIPLRDTDNLITGGISIELPLTDRNQGNIEAAVARQRAARLERESLERIVRQEVLAATNRLESVRQALELFDKGVISRSQENLRIVRGAYELGELRLIDVIDEQRRLIEIQRTYTELLRDAYIAAVEVEKACGAPVR